MSTFVLIERKQVHHRIFVCGHPFTLQFVCSVSLLSGLLVEFDKILKFESPSHVYSKWSELSSGGVSLLRGNTGC